MYVFRLPLLLLLLIKWFVARLASISSYLSIISGLSLFFLIRKNSQPRRCSRRRVCTIAYRLLRKRRIKSLHYPIYFHLKESLLLTNNVIISARAVSNAQRYRRSRERWRCDRTRRCSWIEMRNGRFKDRLDRGDRRCPQWIEAWELLPRRASLYRSHSRTRDSRFASLTSIRSPIQTVYQRKKKIILIRT